VRAVTPLVELSAPRSLPEGIQRTLWDEVLEMAGDVPTMVSATYHIAGAFPKLKGS
jgi:hypothetical protein